MGARGPRPLPTALAKQRGYKRRPSRTVPGKEPERRGKVPTRAPAALQGSAVACEAWRMLRSGLTKLKVLSQDDSIALEGLCVAYARALDADKLVRKHGLITAKWDGSYVKNPAVDISRQAWSEVRRFAQEFGITPSARTRVREIANGESEDTDANTHANTPEGFLFGKREAKVAGHIGSRGA